MQWLGLSTFACNTLRLIFLHHILIWTAGHVRITEEFHVAPERNPRELPACALAIGEPKNFPSKPDRERLHLHAAEARHHEVTKLVEENHQRNHEQKCGNGNSKIREKMS